MAWLMLVPFAVAAFVLSSWCGKRGGIWRLLGVLVSLAIGGACVGVSYFWGFEGYEEWRSGEMRHVTDRWAGLLGMAVGGATILAGVAISASTTRKPCPNCGRYIRDEQKSCQYCGAEGEQENQGRVEEDPRRRAALGRMFCKRCGAELMAPGGPCRECDDVKAILCPNCHLDTPVDEKVCLYCGTALD